MYSGLSTYIVWLHTCAFKCNMVPHLSLQYHKILDRDFSVGSGELTATLKLKRNVVNEMYKKEIDALYKD